MPIKGKKNQELYGKVIGSCYNQGGSKKKCKARAEAAVMSKKKKSAKRKKK